MLDFRHETFLELFKQKNYAKTAEALHITQPAVSQHIKYLEELYEVTLIAEKGKVFSLTPAGKELLWFIQSANSGVKHLKKRIAQINTKNIQEITIGATRSIGEGILPHIISKILQSNDLVEFHVLVENTNSLVEKLQDGQIDFALIEGYFDKSTFETIPFSVEEFIGICSANSPLAAKSVDFSDLLEYRHIVREEGSGSREIYEEILHENHMKINDFHRLIEVNNLTAIKKMVADDAGISFLYKFTVLDEIQSRKVIPITINNFSALRNLHFVFQKDNLTNIDHRYWFDKFLEIYQQ